MSECFDSLDHTLEFVVCGDGQEYRRVSFGAYFTSDPLSIGISGVIGRNVNAVENDLDAVFGAIVFFAFVFDHLADAETDRPPAS